MSNNQKILRLRAVKEWTGLSRSTIYLMIKNGEFPNSVKIGARAVGWLDSDLQAWIELRISQKETSHSNLSTGGYHGTKS